MADTTASAHRAGGPLHVVVAGGGIAGAEALLALRALAGDRVELTLVSPEPDLVYRPLAVAEPFALGHADRHPLPDLAAEAGATLIEAAVDEVEEAARRVVLSDGRTLAFDALLVAVGAKPVPGIDQASTWWPQGDPELYGGLLRDIEEGYVRRVVFAIPLGAVWPLPLYELALMTAREAAGMGMSPELTVVTPEAVPLALFGPEASAALIDELREVDIRLEMATLVRVERANPYRVVLQPTTRRLDADRVISIPRVLGPSVKGLPRNGHGFLPTEIDGRVRGTARVWAAGDGIAYPVKYGGLATQQADIAATAIARLAGASVEDPPHRLTLVGTLMTGGRPRALGRREQGTREASPVWLPAGKVSGRYLEPYLEARSGPRAAPAVGGSTRLQVERELPGLDAGTGSQTTFSALAHAPHPNEAAVIRFGENMREFEERLDRSRRLLDSEPGPADAASWR